MCARQMEAQVKTELRPESAIIQLKAVTLDLDPAKKANKPSDNANETLTRGRPARSMYARMRGA